MNGFVMSEETRSSIKKVKKLKQQRREVLEEALMGEATEALTRLKEVTKMRWPGPSGPPGFHVRKLARLERTVADLQAKLEDQVKKKKPSRGEMLQKRALESEA